MDCKMGETLSMPLWTVCSVRNAKNPMWSLWLTNRNWTIIVQRTIRKRGGEGEQKWIARVIRFVHVHSFCLLRLLLYCRHSLNQQAHAHQQTLCCQAATAVLLLLLLRMIKCTCVLNFFTVVCVKQNSRCICVKIAHVVSWCWRCSSTGFAVRMCVCVCVRVPIKLTVYSIESMILSWAQDNRICCLHCFNVFYSFYCEIYTWEILFFVNAFRIPVPIRILTFKSFVQYQWSSNKSFQP